MKTKKILKKVLYLMLIFIFVGTFAGCKNSGFVFVEG